MSSNWKKVKINSICSQIKRGISPRYSENQGLLVINQKCIRDQRICLEKCRRNDLDSKNISTDKYVCQGDVLINSTGVGTLGRVAQVKELPEPSTVDSHVTIVRPDPSLVCMDYFGWAVRSNESFIETLGEGSTGQTELSRIRLGELEIPLPSFKEQRQIADLLNPLDDKIELNRQMCKTLEDIAATLFKSWFIDFDPVKAKAAGRKPEGLSPEIAVLFPDRFTDSSLGQIPQGWNVGKIKDTALQIKTAITPLNYSNEEFYHYSLPSYDRDKIPARDLGSSIKSNKTIISQKCVLLSKLNPEIPRVWLPQQDGKLRSICSTEFLVYEPKEYFSCEYLYCFFIESSFRLRLQGMVTGTSKSHQRVQPTALLSIDCVVPSQAVLNEFKNVTKTVFEKIQEIKHQTSILTNIRNFLLPKLINGEVKIQEAETLISATI